MTSLKCFCIKFTLDFEYIHLTYLSNTNATRTSTSQVMRSNLFSPPNTRLSPRHWNLKTLIVPCNGGLPPNSSKLINFYSPLTLSWRRLLSYRNQSIDLLRKSMDWFLYDNGLRHERVKSSENRRFEPVRLHIEFW